MKDNFILIMGLVCIAVMGAVLLIQANGEPSQQDITRYEEVLEVHGFTNAQIGAAAFWGCGKDDSPFNSREFHATGANGHHVHGVVCCGMWAKGCTVRIQ